MTDDGQEFPEDYRNTLVTLDDNVKVRTKDVGGQYIDFFLCVEYSEGDTWIEFFQPNVGETDNDVLRVKRDTVRSIQEINED